MHLEIKIIKEINYPNIEHSVNEFLRDRKELKIEDIKICGTDRNIIAVIIFKSN
jgi:hypothetical protein